MLRPQHVRAARVCTKLAKLQEKEHYHPLAGKIGISSMYGGISHVGMLDNKIPRTA